jgi:uncharacterized protein (DUF924 family)
MSLPDPAAVVGFWREAGPTRWYKKDTAFDDALRARFEPAHMAAARRELDSWAATAEGALALLLLLDQVPRNIYRGTAHPFATDPLARRVANDAIASGHDRAVEPGLRQFFVLPFEHSERLEDQDRAVALAEGDAEVLKWALIHRDIIVRFGRFPHRNAALGRDPTEDEAAFLRNGGFGG